MRKLGLKLSKKTIMYLLKITCIFIEFNFPHIYTQNEKYFLKNLRNTRKHENERRYTIFGLGA